MVEKNALQPFIHQFRSLSMHRFDGMEQLIQSFNNILEEFRNKRHDLLDFHNNRKLWLLGGLVRSRICPGDMCGSFHPDNCTQSPCDWRRHSKSTLKRSSLW